MDKKKMKVFRDRLMEERSALLGVVGRNEDYGREADQEATQDPPTRRRTPTPKNSSSASPPTIGRY